MGLSFMLYPLITQPQHYYLLQVLFGIGAALNVTNWRKLFALNIDKGKEGLEYGIYDTAISISVTLFSILIGYIANLGDKYFDTTMSVSGLIIMLSGIWVSLIYTAQKRKSRK